MCRVIYYTTKHGENPVKEFINSLNIRQRLKILRIFEIVESYGINSIPRHIKKLSGTTLWEIKILGEDNIRIVYIIPQRSIILVLHGFIKKTKKTPKREINLAIRRFNDWGTSHTLDK